MSSARWCLSVVDYRCAPEPFLETSRCQFITENFSHPRLASGERLRHRNCFQKVNCCMYTSTTIPRNKSGEIVLLFFGGINTTHMCGARMGSETWKQPLRERRWRGYQTHHCGTEHKRVPWLSLVRLSFPSFDFCTHTHTRLRIHWNRLQSASSAQKVVIRNSPERNHSDETIYSWMLLALWASKRSFVLFRDNCLKASSLFLFVIEISTEKTIFALRSLNFARCRSKTTPTTYLCHNDVSRRHMKF